MFKELKTLNAILNSYKSDKNVLVLASKSDENENLIYHIFFLYFNKVKEMRIFRIELDNVFYVLTDKKILIDDIVLAMEMGLNIRELNLMEYQLITELIGEINDRVKNYEESIKSKTKKGI